MGYNHDYSNVICIGDEFTNEIDEYKTLNLWRFFDNHQYTFKSYPQLLGEKLDCEWESYGKSELTHTQSFSQLISKLDYILSFDNPLVIFQFGNFFSPYLIGGGDNESEIFHHNYKKEIVSFYIDEFINTCNFLNKIKSVDIYGFFMFDPNIELPKSKHILKFSTLKSNYEMISSEFKELSDVKLKSTKDNEFLSDMIIKELFPSNFLF